MRVGVVVIGRNEARNLEQSLRAVRQYEPALVYVDSNSSDGSVSIAQGMGVAVVRLGSDPPQSAARGRNAGRSFLHERFPMLQYVQFVDGDTAVEPGWIERATEFLDQHADVAVVAGRLRERFRDRNVYHRLADMEFDRPTGDVETVGGIALYRLSAFDNARGFDPYVVSGEERELCRRITSAGMRIVRLPDTMAHHDICMDNARQWWKRTQRSGYTSAEHLADRHIMGREVLSMLAWGALLPSLSLALVPPTLGVSLWGLGAYGVLWHRIRNYKLKTGATKEDASLFATATVLGKLPEAAGVFEFAARRLLDDSPRLDRRAKP